MWRKGPRPIRLFPNRGFLFFWRLVRVTSWGDNGYAEDRGHSGEDSAWLHRGACEGAWRAACDADDLTIPPELDRRGEIGP
jgi:hypothetical protein